MSRVTIEECPDCGHKADRPVGAPSGSVSIDENGVIKCHHCGYSSGTRPWEMDPALATRFAGNDAPVLMDIARYLARKFPGVFYGEGSALDFALEKYGDYVIAGKLQRWKAAGKNFNACLRQELKWDAYDHARKHLREWDRERPASDRLESYYPEASPYRHADTLFGDPAEIYDYRDLASRFPVLTMMRQGGLNEKQVQAELGITQAEFRRRRAEEIARLMAEEQPPE